MRAVLVGLGIVLAFLVAQVLGSLATAALGLDLDLEDIDLAGAIALCVTELVTLAAALLLIPRPGGAARIAWRGRLARPRAGLLALLPAGIIVVGISMLVSIGRDPFISPGLALGTAGGLVVAAILIAVAEELWFRGLLIDGLGGERRPWLSIYGSAILFGIPHLDGSRAALLNAGGVVLAIGIPFAVVRLRMHSLLPLIFWHAVVDAWAFLHTADIQATGTPSNAEILGGWVMPGLVAGGYLVWFMRSGSRPAILAADR